MREFDGYYNELDNYLAVKPVARSCATGYPHLVNDFQNAAMPIISMEDISKQKQREIGTRVEKGYGAEGRTDITERKEILKQTAFKKYLGANEPYVPAEFDMKHGADNVNIKVLVQRKTLLQMTKNYSMMVLFTKALQDFEPAQFLLQDGHVS